MSVEQRPKKDKAQDRVARMFEKQQGFSSNKQTDQPEADFVGYREYIERHPELGILIKMSAIRRDPNNPRKSKGDVEGLAQSIDKLGLISPISVRWILEDRYFLLIAGERRFLAHELLGRDKIQAVILNSENTRARQLAENIQRLEMNPLDLSISIQSMIEEDKLTHDRLAKELGKSRQWIGRAAGLQKNLSTEDQAVLEQCPPEATPRIDVIYEALKLDTPTRHAILRGELRLTRQQVREKVKTNETITRPKVHVYSYPSEDRKKLAGRVRVDSPHAGYDIHYEEMLLSAALSDCRRRKKAQEDDAGEKGRRTS